MPGGVPAAPNRSRITAECLAVSQDQRSPRKWLYRLALRSMQPLHGGAFARAGDQVDAFTVGESPAMSVGATIEAEAEFVGGPREPVFRLHHVHARHQDDQP